jgi:hypothetical protein
MPRILDKYSVETMSNYKHTGNHKMKTLSNKMLALLERLGEMFPKQAYQTRLEQYINSKNPTNAAEVDYWQRQYDSEAQYWGRGL